MKSKINTMPESKRFTPRDVDIMPFVSRAFYVMEIWKDIQGYEGIYLVSNKGNVKNVTRNNRLFKSKKRDDGYIRIVLSKDNITKMFYVHRLVASVFIKNEYNKPEVNHINGIRHDNTVENLEWVTKSENYIHAYRVLGSKHSQLGRYGKYHNRSLGVIQFGKDGNKIDEFDCIKDAGLKNKINRRNISLVCKNKRNYAGGFIWKYK